MSVAAASNYTFIFQNKVLVSAKNLIVAIFSELYALTYSMATAYKGYRKTFTYYGINPKQLTAEEAKKPAVLFSHGYKGNQSTGLGLAEEVMKTGEFNFFTANFDYNDNDPSKHHRAMRECIERIRDIYQAAGQELHLTLVGHSRGATESARLAYCKLPKKPIAHCTIDKVISIAGRLRVTPKCHPAMIDLCNKIDAAIKNHPEIPLRVIVSILDWMVPFAASMVVDDPAHAEIVYNKSHLSIPFSKQGIDAAVRFLQA